MKERTQEETNNINRRGNFKATLAVKWVRTHRPDIWEIIVREAEIKFPAKKLRMKNLPLPESLQKAE